MHRSRLACAVAAAIPAAVAAAPVENTAAYPQDFGGDATVASIDSTSDAGYSSPQPRNRYVGRTEGSLLGDAPADPTWDLMGTNRPLSQP